MRDVRGTILEGILADAQAELAEAKRRRPVSELERRLADAPPVRPLAAALRGRFSLIAELKVRSPSQGPMRAENVAGAPDAYERSPIVAAVSVLTNATHFGMSIERLAEVRARSSKPVLRKEFIFDEYQVVEARAFGADAILLMANLLEPEELRRLHALARELGMDALFECHTQEQIASVPPDAQLYGINSRSFDRSQADYAAARAQRAQGANWDPTTDLSRFELGRYLPRHAVRVAESGVSPASVGAVRALGWFDAVLVGSWLLLAPEGVGEALQAFERALAE